MKKVLISIFFIIIGFSLACSSGGILEDNSPNDVPDTIMRNFSIAPNPSSDVMVIRYSLEDSVSKIDLHIYDVQGNIVKVIENLPNSKSNGTIIAYTWDMLDFENKKVKNGIYIGILTIKSGEKVFKATKKIAVSR